MGELKQLHLPLTRVEEYELLDGMRGREAVRHLEAARMEFKAGCPVMYEDGTWSLNVEVVRHERTTGRVSCYNRLASIKEAKDLFGGEGDS